MKIYYNPELKLRARELRKRGTPAEIKLWNRLRAKQFYNLQFMRQKPIDEYIVDFYCSKLRLVIEIDGITHNDRIEYDIKRQEKLESLGLHVLRFTEFYTNKNVQGVLYTIEEFIKKQPPDPLF